MKRLAGLLERAMRVQSNESRVEGSGGSKREMRRFEIRKMRGRLYIFRRKTAARREGWDASGTLIVSKDPKPVRISEFLC